MLAHRDMDNNAAGWIAYTVVEAWVLMIHTRTITHFSANISPNDNTKLLDSIEMLVCQCDYIFRYVSKITGLIIFLSQIRIFL